MGRYEIVKPCCAPGNGPRTKGFKKPRTWLGQTLRESRPEPIGSSSRRRLPGGVALRSAGQRAQRHRQHRAGDASAFEASQKRVHAAKSAGGSARKLGICGENSKISISTSESQGVFNWSATRLSGFLAGVFMKKTLLRPKRFDPGPLKERRELLAG